MDVEGWAALQTEWTVQWHEAEVGRAEGAAKSEAEVGMEMGGLVRAEHRANFDLWHEEDKARDPGATEAEIARVKRAIDGLNQRRNDLVERIDEWMLAAMGAQAEGAVLHSETPGMMVDRLSILALKIFHTHEQTERAEATEAHRDRNRTRLTVLEEQRADLAGAMRELLRAVRAGERRFKVYRQMKMYNDPELNPRMYHARRS